MRKEKTTIAMAQKKLLTIEEVPKNLYKTFNNYYIDEKIDNTISYCLYDIIEKKILPLLNGRYLVKYLFLQDSNFQTPFYTFNQNQSIDFFITKVRNEFDEKYNKKKNSIFAVRIDFIDPDSNLLSFIIILNN